MKSKLTITVASILSVLTLVGVGFAKWIISNPSVSADQNGTITAETVSDKSYTLDAVIAADDKIVFGDLVSKNYITNPKISYPSGSETITKDVKMNGTADDVITIPNTVFTGINNEVTDTVKEATLEITIKFGWGTYFTVDGSVVNPYTFYNKKTYDKAIGTEANTVLTAISGLKDVSYTVTISGTTNTPNVSGK